MRLPGGIPPRWREEAVGIAGMATVEAAAGTVTAAAAVVSVDVRWDARLHRLVLRVLVEPLRRGRLLDPVDGDRLWEAVLVKVVEAVQLVDELLVLAQDVALGHPRQR